MSKHFYEDFALSSSREVGEDGGLFPEEVIDSSVLLDVFMPFSFFQDGDLLFDGMNDKILYITVKMTQLM